MTNAVLSPVTIDSCSTTVAHAFLAALSSRGERPALRWRGDDGDWCSWTTGELAFDVARVAAGLRELGVQPGQRVVLLMRNVAEFHVADLAVMFAGATPISIYNSSAPEQIAYLINSAQASVAIVEDARFLGRIDAVRDQLPGLQQIVVVRDAPTGRDDVHSWSSVRNHDPVELEEAAGALSPTTAATIIYTSGTTGPPKGVVLTHENVCVMGSALAQSFGVDVSGKRVISYLPMAHIAERNVSHYGMIFHGLEVVCCPDAGALNEYLVHTRPHLMFGVPRVWEKIRSGILSALAANPEMAGGFDAAIEAAKPIALARSWDTATEQQHRTWQTLQDTSLRQVREMVGLDHVEYAVTGAAPIPGDVVEWYNALGVPLSEVYGLSECTGTMTWSPHRIKPGTVGPPVPGCEVRIADDGEVVCRGPIVFPGYLNEPEKTAEVVDADGWLHTGDIGRLDSDGYLTIVDRKKELIITAGGKNISPANLEAALKTIPLVAQAFVVGDAKPYVGALVLLDPDVAVHWAKQRGIAFTSLSELADHPDVVAEIDGSVAAAMEAFNQAEKVKKVRVLAVEWLPDSDELTPTAKLKRRAIKAKYADEIDSLYA